jgi:hypothetical protein
LNLQKILIIFTIIILYSGCVSKDKFYEGWYNSIQNDNFCITSQECKNKRLHPNISNQNEKISYDDYKNSTK